MLAEQPFGSHHIHQSHYCLPISLLDCWPSFEVILYVDCWGAVTVHCFSCKEGYRFLFLLQILNLRALCQGEVKKIVENNDEAGPVSVNSPTESPYQLFERRRFRWISKLLCR